MSIVDIGNGLLIDDETGEFVEGTLPGDERLLLLAHRYAEASAQEDAWKNVRRAIKAVFVKEQAERAAQYGDVIISIRQSAGQKIDPEKLADVLREDEAPRSVLLEFVRRSSSFPRLGWSAEASPYVAPALVDYAYAPYIISERVRRLAPGTGGQE